MSDKKQMPQKQKSDKPLFMRIIMLAIAAVMVLGIVIGALPPLSSNGAHWKQLGRSAG